ncbi:unnamed protein product [Amoebophrya sp. A120]|nr:unnamed protein product [Amoebophrya sp. A120]|eukprot:GSA120T00005753001.1
MPTGAKKMQAFWLSHLLRASVLIPEHIANAALNGRQKCKHRKNYQQTAFFQQRASASAVVPKHREVNPEEAAEQGDPREDDKARSGNTSTTTASLPSTHNRTPNDLALPPSPAFEPNFGAGIDPTPRPHSPDHDPQMEKMMNLLTKSPLAKNECDPITLQCSCKCGECVFHVADVNACKKQPLQIFHCHCSSCRRHAGAAWGSYLTQNGKPFSYRNNIDVAKSNFWELDVPCKTVEKFQAMMGPKEEACMEVPRKILCKKCKSILMIRFGEDQVVVAAGSIDDGDYEDDDKGRVPVEELWPAKKYPSVLKTPVGRDFSVDERAGWYVKEAGSSQKKYRQREKKIVTAEASKNAKRAPWTNPEVTGGCYCGAVKFEARVFPPELQHCYCSVCRKFSGASFQTWAWVYNKHLRWIDEFKQLKFEKTSSEGGRHFCKLCGTTMTIVYDDEAKSTTWLAAGCYDDESLFEREEQKCGSKAGATPSTGERSFRSNILKRHVLGAGAAAPQDEKNTADYNNSDTEDPSGALSSKPRSQPETSEPNSGATTVSTTADSRSRGESPASARSDTKPGSLEEPKVNSDVKKVPEAGAATSVVSEEEKKKQLEYVWRRLYEVSHICCLSVQPWYRIPDDVGTTRTPLAG